jgi:hypothetical protein
VVYPFNGLVFSHRKEILIDDTACMSPENFVLSETKPCMIPCVWSTENGQGNGIIL